MSTTTLNLSSTSLLEGPEQRFDNKGVSARKNGAIVLTLQFAKKVGRGPLRTNTVSVKAESALELLGGILDLVTGKFVGYSIEFIRVVYMLCRSVPIGNNYPTDMKLIERQRVIALDNFEVEYTYDTLSPEGEKAIRFPNLSKEAQEGNMEELDQFCGELFPKVVEFYEALEKKLGVI